MGFQFNGTQANVTLTTEGNLGISLPSDNQEIINVAGTGNGATQNAYTVPAGKIFYLFCAPSTCGVAQSMSVYLNDGATRVITHNINAIPSIMSGSIPFAKYTAGEIVKVNATASVLYSIVGIQITA
jgi:hypothetical protein